MLKIHIINLPKTFKHKAGKDGWLKGTIFFDQNSTTAVFLGEDEKPLFQFSRPVVITQTRSMIIYHAFVYTKYEKGRWVGELCELPFMFV